MILLPLMAWPLCSRYGTPKEAEDEDAGGSDDGAADDSDGCDDDDEDGDGSDDWRGGGSDSDDGGGKKRKKPSTSAAKPQSTKRQKARTGYGLLPPQWLHQLCESDMMEILAVSAVSSAVCLLSRAS